MTLTDFSVKDRKTIYRVARELKLRLSRPGVTQAKLAKELDEKRTSLSHISNSVVPSTKNPVFKSMTIVNRIDKKLRPPREEKPVTNRSADLIAQGVAEWIEDLKALVREEAKKAVQEEIVAAKAAKAAWADSSSTPAKASTKKAPAKKAAQVRIVRRGQIWQPRDKRRAGDLVEIVVVHSSVDPAHHEVTVKGLKSGTISRSKYAGFLKRFEYITASKGRLKKAQGN